MNEHLRLKTVRRVLRLSQKGLAQAIGRQQGSISDIERGRNSVDGIAHLLKLAFLVNPEWLKKGDGDMLLPGGRSPGLAATGGPVKRTAQESTPAAAGSRQAGVPYFNTELNDRTSGRDEGSPLVSEPPEYYIDFRPFNDCTAYFPYHGDSMYPKYLHGDIIAVKEVKNPDIILWGEAYLVVTNEQANSLKTVRLILEHRNKAKVILRAVNPAFTGDIVIDKKSILSLHLVKGKITVMI